MITAIIVGLSISVMYIVVYRWYLGVRNWLEGGVLAIGCGISGGLLTWLLSMM